MNAEEIATDRESLEAWLKTQPRTVSIAIATRTAMRVAPLLWTDRSIAEIRFALILPVFRAISVSLTATEKRGIELCNSTDAAVHATQAAANVADAAAHADTAYAAARATHSAAYAAAHATDAEAAADDAAHGAAAAAYAAAYAASAAAAGESLKQDIRFLLEAGSPDRLVTQPLWANEAPAEIMEQWSAMKSALLSRDDENWWVWTTWYDERLRGAPVNFDLELEKALIPDEVWKMGPADANAEIAKLMEKYAPIETAKEPELPPEKSAPIDFILTNEGIEPGLPPGSENERRGLDGAWQGLCDQADILIAGLGDNWPFERAILEKYRQALGDNAAAVNIFRLGVNGGMLKGLSETADKFLMEPQAEALKNLTAQHAHFVAGSPAWRQHEAEEHEQIAAPEIEAKVADVAAEIVDKTEGLTEEARAQIEEMKDSRGPFGYHPYLRTVLKLLHRLFGWGLEKVRDGIGEGIKFSTKAVVIGSIAALITNAGEQLTRLATLIPAEYGWLAEMVAFFARVLP